MPTRAASRGSPSAHGRTCALADDGAKLPFDAPEVQAVRRDVLGWWIPLLGDALVCLTTLALDSVHYGGAVTVATDASIFADDPFARIFPGTLVETELFCRVPPPAGPPIERYAGVAWPGGSWPTLGGQLRIRPHECPGRNREQDVVVDDELH